MRDLGHNVNRSQNYEAGAAMQPIGEARTPLSIKQALGLSAGYVVCFLLAAILMALPAVPFLALRRNS